MNDDMAYSKVSEIVVRKKLNRHNNSNNED